MLKARPRHILMTADTVGGVWTYALELARALQSFDIEIALATMGGAPNAAQQAAAGKLDNVHVYESDFQLEWMDDPWRDVETAGEWLLDLEARVSPDLIHLNNYAHGALPWEAPVLMVGHSCVYSWYRAVRKEYPPEHFEIYHRKVTQGLQQAGCVTAPTETMLRALRLHYGAFPEKPAIHNGRRENDFLPKKKEPFVLTVGRLWDEAKNAAALEHVAPHLDWPIYLAGEDHHPNGTQAHFDGLKLLGRLSQPELADWLSRAAIYALPARYEPFGLSALEAALAGCALVLGDIPSLREVWGKTALYVPPDDPNALRDTLQRLIDDRPLRRRMARKARDRARTYTPQRMAKGYMRCYKDLLAPEELAQPILSPASSL